MNTSYCTDLWVCNHDIEGVTQGRGRPKLTLKSTVVEDLQSLAIHKHSAEDRTQWKLNIHIGNAY